MVTTYQLAGERRLYEQRDLPSTWSLQARARRYYIRLYSSPVFVLRTNYRQTIRRNYGRYVVPVRYTRTRAPTNIYIRAYK